MEKDDLKTYCEDFLGKNPSRKKSGKQFHSRPPRQEDAGDFL